MVEQQIKNKWWGYRHTSGSIQAKRYFDIRDINEAVESDFVQQIVYPFYADNREEALAYVEQMTTVSI